MKNHRLCQCGNLLKKKHKVSCSRECQMKYNHPTKGKKIHGHRYLDRKTMMCKCGKTKDMNVNCKQKYCSCVCFIKFSHPMRGRKQSTASNAKNSEKLKLLWKTSKYRVAKCARSESTILAIKARRAYYRNNHITKPEHKINLLVKWNQLPWKFTGNGKFSLCIGIKKLYPDFLNINGEKKVIEVNGCYWHGCPKCFPNGGYKGLIDNTKKRKQTYQSIGWECISIWEHELRQEGWENKILMKLGAKR